MANSISIISQNVCINNLYKLIAFHIRTKLCQVANLGQSRKKNSFSFDQNQNRFGHFVLPMKISVFTKGIRNQGKFGHVISLAQK